MKTIKAIALILAVMLVSAESFAQVYLGATYGVTDSNYIGDEDDPADFEGDTGMRIYLGNSVSKTFSFEVAYIDLGDYEVGTADGLDDVDEDSDTLSLSAYEVSYVAKWPMRRNLSLYGRFGGIYWEGVRKITLVNQTSREITTDRFGASLGFGVNYKIFKRFGLTLEFNGYQIYDRFNAFYGLGLYGTF